MKKYIKANQYTPQQGDNVVDCVYFPALRKLWNTKTKILLVACTLLFLMWLVMNSSVDLMDKFNEAVMRHEIAQDEYEKSIDSLLEIKIEVAKDCLADPDKTFEEKEECKYTSEDSLTKVFKRRYGSNMIPQYDFPGDLIGGHLKMEGVRMTQSSYEGIANEPEAFDVGFGIVPEELKNDAVKLYFPDWDNKEVDWIMYENKDFDGIEKTWNKYCGNFISLQNKELGVGYIVCHSNGNNKQDGKTGESMGVYSNTGKQTGPHTHYEAYKYDELSGEWFNIHYVVENWHDKANKKVETNKELADQDYWYISSYYTPVEGQSTYFNGSYASDYEVNCHGNCLSPADGGELYTQEDKYQVVACPKEYPLGTKFSITLPDDHSEYPNKNWTATCRDRGGAVRSSDTNKKGQNQLDLWSGIGRAGQPHPWIGELSTRKAKVEIIFNN